MSETVIFRVGIDDYNTIKAAAEKKGLTISAYCRNIILQNSNVVIVEGLTEIHNAIYRMVDTNVDSEDINHLTEVVTDCLERILDKLDSLNA